MHGCVVSGLVSILQCTVFVQKYNALLGIKWNTSFKYRLHGYGKQS